jgi:hypothetical protein
METKRCEGCEQVLGTVEALLWSVCLGCTKARHRAVIRGGRCSCGPRKRRPREVSTGPVRFARRWIACDRCLGAVAQLN